MSERYQSHHTGIETEVWEVVQMLISPTNRTILELKHDAIERLKSDNADYQSHHTGIET